MRTIDLNCDLGEDDSEVGRSTDSCLLRLVSSINLACGGHAGSPSRVDELIRESLPLRLGIGAHPAYPDRHSFGRRVMPLSMSQLLESLCEQISLVAEISGSHGTSLQHVKPHGALYHQASHDSETANCVVLAILRSAPGAIVVGPFDSCLLTCAAASGLTVAAEGFADRRYCSDGTLVPRSAPNALINDPVEAARQAARLSLEEPIVSDSRSQIVVPCDTICLHSDSPDAVSLAQAVRHSLNDLRIVVQPLIPQPENPRDPGRPRPRCS
jgi:UPF0271 protein